MVFGRSKRRRGDKVLTDKTVDLEKCRMKVKQKKYFTSFSSPSNRFV